MRELPSPVGVSPNTGRLALTFAFAYQCGREGFIMPRIHGKATHLDQEANCAPVLVERPLHEFYDGRLELGRRRMATTKEG